MTALDQSQASPAPLPSLKTLLVTDLVDSTKLTEKLGDRHAGEIYERHDRLARDLLLRFGGREIAKADGFTLIFERPIDAVCFALVYHDELAALSQELGTDAEKDGFRLAARVGIHLGEVVLRENPPEDIKHGARPIEMEGLAVSIVARVMSLAGGAQTLMTRAPFDLARRGAVGVGEVDDDIRWLEHGPYLFKGVSETMTVCEVGREGCAPLTPPPNSEKAERDIAPGDEKTLGWRPAPGLAIPERKGWKLERRLGVGGFGEVWLAEQKRTHEQRAFKFCFRADRLRSLKRELTLFRLIKEVLGERPDIVRLYDVQLDEAPFYLEMAYAAGGDLPGWAEGRGGLGVIDLNTRLEIVAQVADALSAAHSVGVIHKDVKPSNVLVHEERDGRLQARLSDFGIGQLLDKESLEQAGVTVTGFTETAPLTELASRTGTRLYMAPELMAGKPASIQSDIYALGVLFYQVVVGDLNRPLAQGWEAQVKDELLREDIAACVAGDPGHRLSSAGLLARSLRSLAERRRQREAERKRVAAEARRRRMLRLTGASAGVLGLLAIVAGLGYWNADQQRRRAEAAEHEQRLARQDAEAARANAEAARNEEERERRKAETLYEFVTKALVSSDPNQQGTQDFKVTDAMQQAIDLLDVGELKDEPETRAALQLTISSILHGNARSAEALRLAEQALGTYQELHPGDHRDIAAAQTHVASYMESLGRSEEALSIFDAALAMFRRLYQGDHSDIATSLNNLGFCLESLGRFAEALAKHEEALRMRQRLLPDDHPHVATSLNNIAICLQSLDRSAEALPIYEAALEIFKRLFPCDHPHVATSLNNVASCLQNLDRSTEALPKYEEALRMYERLFPGDNPYVALSRNNVATCLESLGRWDEALPKYEAALEMLKRLFPRDHPQVATNLNNVASCLQNLDRSAEALPKYEEALRMNERFFPGDNPYVAMSLNNLASCLESLGRSQEALCEYEASLEMFRRALPSGHSDSLYPQIGLAATFVALAQYVDAEALLRCAAEQCERLEDSRRLHWRGVLEQSVRLYEAWHAAEPEKGYAAEAAEWRAKLEAFNATTQPATSQPAP